MSKAELKAELKEYEESIFQSIAQYYWDTFLELCEEAKWKRAMTS